METQIVQVSLSDYLRKYSQQTTEFRVSVQAFDNHPDYDECVEFLIHPLNVDGETLTYRASSGCIVESISTIEHVFDEATFKLLQEKVLSALNQDDIYAVRKDLAEIARFAAIDIEEAHDLSGQSPSVQP